MRVLMISKATVTRSYRTKLWYLNQAPNVTVGLVVPQKWDQLPFEPMAEDATYPLFIRPIWLNGRNHLHRYPGIRSIIRQFAPDLIHIDEEHYSWVTAEVVSIANKMGVPTLFFTWQNIFKNYPWPFSRMEQKVLRSARGAIAGNQEALGVLRKKGFVSPIEVIPQFGTDHRIFYPMDPAEVRLRLGLEGTTAIGYVGRMIADKGLDDLLQAMIPVLSQDSTVRLVLVGSGPWSEAGKQAAETGGVGTQVIFVPWMASTEMPLLMNALDILVLPSRTTPSWKEQFGRVLTEAMATKTAVVGSSSGEIPSVIGDAGMVFPEGDVARLSDILTTLSQDRDLRQRYGELGFARVRGRFTQEAVAKSTLAVYTKLLTNGRK
ncbi:MAG: glycosyltransferase family 4 protein [Firmicutes bacterium]|jgi:glycosyltransferase involved in cell wall biosynthesis|nr:glycosyltransferase family 4 protein [Bacillota bacterium]